MPTTIHYKPPKVNPQGGMVYTFPADCGKCLPCLKKRKNQWSFRLVQEKKEAFSSYFVTLTYNDTFLPMGEYGSVGNINDHKDFIKFLNYYENPDILEARYDISIEELSRLKNAIKEDKKLRYYSVFEYGDERGRVHWHYLLFNVHDIRNISRAWSEQVCIGKDGRKKLYAPGRGKGKVDIDDCNVNTIDYVLKYMIKTPLEKQNKEVREKQFHSKGMGIGVADKQFVDLIKREDGNQVVNSRGIKIPLPRYYNKKFLSDKERDIKSSYIRQKVEYEKGKRDADLIRRGYNPDEVEVPKIMARQNYINNRLRREIKNHEEKDI